MSYLAYLSYFDFIEHLRIDNLLPENRHDAHQSQHCIPERSPQSGTQ